MMRATADVKLPHGPDFLQLSDPDRLRAALAAAGLVDVAVAAVAQAWPFDAPDEFLEAILQGAVRAKALLEARDARALETIRGVVAEGTGHLFHGRDGSGTTPGPRSS